MLPPAQNFVAGHWLIFILTLARNHGTKMAYDFRGKKVLITGAGQGIGRGIAVALAKAGCQVYALDCVKENIDLLAKDFTNVIPIHQDLSNWDTTKATLEGLEAMDGLVNNAGVVKGYDPALEVNKEDIDATLSVNLFAVINCTQVIGKKMIDAGKKGSIVNVSSIGAQLAIPNFMAYTVSKAGVDMVTKQFALELGPHNIRVNSVNPTMVTTQLIADDIRKKDGGAITERTPLARAATVEEVVGPALYLLSDWAAMVTGTTHLVDGGIACNITTKS